MSVSLGRRLEGASRSSAGRFSGVRSRADAWVADARAPRVAMAALGLAAFVLIMYAGRHLNTFLYDEWNFVLNRRGVSFDTFFRPHNEHLSAVPVLVFKAMFQVVGLDTYWPYRVLVALLVVLSGVLVWVLARPRVGPWWALVPATLVLVVGPGADDIIWPFQIGFDGAVACGLGMLVCFDRQSRRADILASFLIFVALFSASVGLAVLAAAVIEVLLRPTRWRRLWVVAIPIVLYGAWYQHYSAAVFKPGNIILTPHFIADAAAQALAALVGLDAAWGPVLVIGVIALVLWRLLSPGEVDVRIWTVLALAVGFWALTGIGRAEQNQPGASRYLFPGAVFVALVVVEALRGTRLPGRGRALAWVVVAAVALMTLSHAGTLFEGADYQAREFTAYVKPELGALELARQSGPVGEDFKPDPLRAPDVVAGKYFSVVDAYGSPGATGDEIAAAEPPNRRAADFTYAAARALGISPIQRPEVFDPPPAPLAVDRAATAVEGGCLVMRPQAATGGVDVVVPPDGLALRTPGPGKATVALQRWSYDFGVVLNQLNPNVWGLLRIGADAAPQPWRARITSADPVRVCAVKAGSVA